MTKLALNKNFSLRVLNFITCSSDLFIDPPKSRKNFNITNLTCLHLLIENETIKKYAILLCLLWGSKPEWVLPYSLFVEVNVMYIPQDPPLVLHLPTSWQSACSWSCPHILLQRWGCRDSNTCSENICEPDALPTELNRDRVKNLILDVTDNAGRCTDLSGIDKAKSTTCVQSIHNLALLNKLSKLS